MKKGKVVLTASLTALLGLGFASAANVNASSVSDADTVSNWVAKIPSQIGPLNSNGTYTVEEGDTIWAIGMHFNVKPSVIESVNGITDPYTLQIGTVLKIEITDNGNKAVLTVENNGSSSSTELNNNDKLDQSLPFGKDVTTNNTTSSNGTESTVNSTESSTTGSVNKSGISTSITSGKTTNNTTNANSTVSNKTTNNNTSANSNVSSKTTNNVNTNSATNSNSNANSSSVVNSNTNTNSNSKIATNENLPSQDVIEILAYVNAYNGPSNVSSQDIMFLNNAIGQGTSDSTGLMTINGNTISVKFPTQTVTYNINDLVNKYYSTPAQKQTINNLVNAAKQNGASAISGMSAMRSDIK